MQGRLAIGKVERGGLVGGWQGSKGWAGEAGGQGGMKGGEAEWSGLGEAGRRSSPFIGK